MSERFQRLMTRTGDVDWPDAGMLSHLSETSRRALLALGVPQEHSPGRRLILEGDQPTSVLVLCQGCVKVEARLENGSTPCRGDRGRLRLARLVASDLDPVVSVAPAFSVRQG
jgi:CRP-like cAMP-binding protein